MARTPAETAPTPVDHQQMSRSNNPEETARLDAAAPEVAMESSRQRYAGSAAGVGSVGFEDLGAYDVGAAEPATPLEKEDPDGPDVIDRSVSGAD